MTQNSSSVAKRRRLLLIPLAIACVIAFIAGAAVAGSSAERDAAERFGTAWADGDYGAMYDELNPDSQSRVSRDDFEAAYSEAMATATATDLAVDDVSGPDDVNGEDVVTLATTVHTNAFGEVTADAHVPVADGSVSWQPNLVFPGLAEGDMIVRYGERPVAGIDDLHRLLIDEAVGVRSTLSILRGVELVTLDIVPEESPSRIDG